MAEGTEDESRVEYQKGEQEKTKGVGCQLLKALGDAQSLKCLALVNHDGWLPFHRLG
jgi:hypothetical protein